LLEFFKEYGLPIADTHSIEECVKAAKSMAKNGEAVLLSPCCASFDLFKSYEDRGRQFKDLVCKL
jgi:UDP-N-acetylmuramoylalanine--D-glutamate ligase